MGREKRLFSLSPSHLAPRTFFFFLPTSLRHKEASAEERLISDIRFEFYSKVRGPKKVSLAVEKSRLFCCLLPFSFIMFLVQKNYVP